MTALRHLLLVAGLAPVPGHAAAQDPVRLIFDTDVGNDIDDALALALIHALESRGEARLLAVTVTKDNRWAAPYIDLVNTFYGRPAIPVGVVKGGPTPADSAMIKEPSERKNPDGAFVYPHDVLDGARAAEAVAVLRQVLASEPDRSVTIVQVGFSTNLARLLDSTADAYSPLGGVDLVKRKVRLLCAMAGNYVYPKPEFNVYTDVPSARRVFADWPTPIVASGFEIGEELLWPASSIDRYFNYVSDHPIAEAYRLFDKMPYDRPTWDLTAVLHAVRPNERYFEVSPRGRITVQDTGNTAFQLSDQGQHRFLVLSPKQVGRIVEAFVDLVSQPPMRPSP